MKTAGKIALGVFAGVVGISAVVYEMPRSKSASLNATLSSVTSKVSIVTTCWYETNAVMETALKSLHNQNVILARPSQFEFITIGCDHVDMILASKYSNRTACVNGKLTARDTGIRMASGDIIVAVDCDCKFPPNFINLLIDPFKNPDVIAVQGLTDHGSPLIEIVGQLPLRRWYQQRISGRASAFRRSAYFALGGFDLSINQKDMDAMVNEEEVGFRQKLQSLGKVVDSNAVSYHLVSMDRNQNRGLHVKN
jgi:glycosyltransferase involved in cell wall biosynthesis